MAGQEGTAETKTQTSRHKSRYPKTKKNDEKGKQSVHFQGTGHVASDKTDPYRRTGQLPSSIRGLGV